MDRGIAMGTDACGEEIFEFCCSCDGTENGAGSSGSRSNDEICKSGSERLTRAVGAYASDMTEM